MAKVTELFKCNVCGHVIEIVVNGVGQLVCCNQPMEHLVEKTDETMFEKHKPVVEKDGELKTVRVGSVPHPMEEEHYIMFIEAISFDKKYIKRKYLKPGEVPELELKCKCPDIHARELCNLHGLFGTEYEE